MRVAHHVSSAASLSLFDERNALNTSPSHGPLKDRADADAGRAEAQHGVVVDDFP